MPVPDQSETISNNPPRKIELPWLILAALLISTLFAGYQSWRLQESDASARFREIAEDHAEDVRRALVDIDSHLKSIAAFAATAPALNDATWREFSHAQHPPLISARQTAETATLSGLVAVQLTIAPAQAGTSASRAFTYGVATGSTDHIDWPIHALQGEETFTVPPGTPLLLDPAPNAEGKVTLVRAWAGATGRPLGSVAALIDVPDLMQRLAARKSMIDATLHDGQTLLSAKWPAGEISRETRYESIRIPFGGRVWQMDVRSTPKLEARLHSSAPRTVILIGVLSAALLAGLIWLLTRLREQARNLAAVMTQQLSDQTKFTEELIEFNPNPIFRQDANGIFVAVNRAWEQLAGRDRRDVIGKTYAQFQSADIAATNLERDGALFSSENGRDTADAVITSADGRTFETIVARQVLRNSDGHIAGLIGNITDVSPLRALEREVERQREQLNLVISSSQQGIWDLDLRARDRAYFSDHFIEMLGYSSPQEILALDWRSALVAEDVDAFRAELVRHFKGQTAYFDVECRAQKKAGGLIWLRVRAIAQRDDTGRAIRFVGSITDITDRRRAQQELVDANIRVTDAARAKEAFLATMSHEIRTPLNGVLGMASLLADTPLNDEQRDYIRLVRTSGDTLLRLIDDVLDFSKIESGRMTLESTPVELAAVVEEAFELVAERVRGKSIALLYDIDDATPVYVLGDPTRLRQIWLNLLSNAIKFTERGEIGMYITTTPADNGQLRLECRVQDSGIGIPASRVNQLFQPFTQVDASTTRKYGGTGLGLVICRRLTQLMGGDIRVESEEGVGSTFIFSVLTSAAAGAIKPYMETNSPVFKGKRLLMVDSHPRRREIVARRYTRWGLQTQAVGPEGAAAVLASNTEIDVLLTDMAETTPEAQQTAAALLQRDEARQRAGEPRIISILASHRTRAAFAREGILPPIRHDYFLLRPVGQARMHDALARAAQNLVNQDIATRPVALSTPETTSIAANEPAAATLTAPTATPALYATSRNRQPLNLLVAEDNEVNQRVVMGMLKNLGHQVQLVGDGLSAVQAAVNGEFDAVLMDIHMPELDGIVAMQRIREQLAGRYCPPIIAMTAHALPGDREHYLGAGLDDYISKPIRANALAEVLQRTTNRRANFTAPTPTIPASPPTPAPLSSLDERMKNIPVLDVEQLADLRMLPPAEGETLTTDAGDPLGGLIALFQSQARERLALLSQQLAAQEWIPLSETAHSLRGATASMGFPRVAFVCKELELKAKSFEPAADSSTISAVLSPLLDSLRQHFSHAESELLRWSEAQQ